MPRRAIFIEKNRAAVEVIRENLAALGLEGRAEVFTSKAATVLERARADIAFLDRALGELFSRCAVDPARIAVAGFSDGASYALAVGLTNGTFVTEIIAFSPGFLSLGDVEGKPRVFISPSHVFHLVLVGE